MLFIQVILVAYQSPVARSHASLLPSLKYDLLSKRDKQRKMRHNLVPISLKMIAMTKFKSEVSRKVLIDLARLFGKLSVLSFGGPAVHIAMIENEVVRRRGWLNHQEFLDLLSAANLIPGPNSTELAIHIGYRQGGWLGLCVAGLAFILPATAIVILASWGYVTYQQVPTLAFLLYGIKPMILGVVLHALWGLGKTAVKDRKQVVASFVITVSAMLGANEFFLLFFSGMAFLLMHQWRNKPSLPLLFLHTPLFATVPSPPAGPSVGSIFLSFAKIGSVLYGSGYVLLAFIRTEFVDRLHWLTETQVLDSIAIGQMTPGPVFTTATFVGYLLAGMPGALAGTVGIFLPAFLCVAISAPFIPQLKRSQSFSSFLEGVNIASLALMLNVSFQLGRTAFVDPLTLALGIIGVILMFRFRANPTYLVMGGGAIGIASKWLGFL